MPNIYAQKMIDMMSRTGQPETTTTTGTTTVKQPNEGLDLSGIMMMLLMNSMFNKKATTSIGETPAPSSGLDMRNIANLAPSTMTSGMDLQKLMQIISSLKLR